MMADRMKHWRCLGRLTCQLAKSDFGDGVYFMESPGVHNRKHIGGDDLFALLDCILLLSFLLAFFFLKLAP